MTRLLTKIAVAAAAMLAMLSCTHEISPDSSFVASSDVQLVIKGKTICTYDPATWQLGFKKSDMEFRMFDDAMKNICTVTCSELPKTEGQKIEATVTWNTVSEDGSAKGKFEVVKVNGKECWLWCSSKSKQIAVTVRYLD